jgi:hypothetical protein
MLPSWFDKKLFVVGVVMGIILAIFLFLSFFMIAKPAIYFYPTFPTQVTASVSSDELFIASEPDVGLVSPAVWKFTAYPDSVLVAGGRQYPYLFYETTYLGRKFPLSYGWSVPYGQLPSVLDYRLKQLGLNDAERKEFLAYWTARLQYSPYYSVYVIPQSEIDSKLRLSVSPKPDTVIRVLIGFRPTAEEEKLVAPITETPQRKGFTVVEWGGFVA